jgi:ribosomal protein L25 (general stress protein Ctc)
LLAILGASVALSANAQQSRRDEQEGVRENLRKGTIQSLRQIEANIVPALKRRGANYIGAEFDAATLRYRLKFVRESSVIWIDIDGRSGAIIAQAGN